MVETFTATALSPWYRLELFVSPAQQLLLTDLLMAMTDVHGFFQQRIDGFSDRQGSMTTSEQVAGRRALVLVVLGQLVLLHTLVVVVLPAVLLLLLWYGGRQGYLKWIDSLSWPDGENK